MIGLLRRLRVTESKHLYLLLIALLLPMQFLPTFRKGVTWFHLINVVILGGYLLSVIIRGGRLRWPFILPFWIYLIGSVLAMYSSSALGANLYALGQDVYLYLWFIALCAMLTTQDDIDYLAAAWCVGALLVILLGYTGPAGTAIVREEFTFRNPNRAAVYFMVSMAFMFAPVYARRRWLRAIMVGLLLLAAYTTGSVSIFGSIVVGAAVMLSVLLYARRGGFWAIRQVLLLLVIGIVVYTSVAYTRVEALLPQLLPSSFGRTPRSFAVRQQIWDEGVEQFKQHPFGIGPGSFSAMFVLSFGPETGKAGGIELHSDYVAALVERGVVGLAGYVLLLLAVFASIIRLVRTAYATHRPEIRVWVAALSGAIVGYFVYSLTHEALHHDTLWLLFGLLVVQQRILQESAVPAPATASRLGGRALAPARAGGTT